MRQRPRCLYVRLFLLNTSIFSVASRLKKVSFSRACLTTNWAADILIELEMRGVIKNKSSRPIHHLTKIDTQMNPGIESIQTQVQKLWADRYLPGRCSIRRIAVELSMLNSTSPVCLSAINSVCVIVSSLLWFDDYLYRICRLGDAGVARCI